MAKHGKTKKRRKEREDQHTIPACYLKAWLDPSCPPNDRYTWVFDRDGREAKPMYPAEMFKESEFYTRFGPDGERDLSLEDGLGKLEDRFARIRTSKFNFRRPLTTDERQDVCAFVAAAVARTRAFRDHHAQQWRSALELADKMQAAIARDPQAFSSPHPSTQRAHGGPAISIEEVREVASRPIQTLMVPAIQAQLPLLGRMRMWVMCTDDSVGFITSDNPCYWVDPQLHKMPPMFRSPALGSPTTEVVMPLSPGQLLVLSHNGPEGYADVPAKVVDHVNRQHRAACTDHFVVRRNVCRETWLEEFLAPPDAWEYGEPA